MKGCVLLGGSFLLSLLFWNSSGFEPAVTSMCTEDWLVARMKRWPFDNGTEVRIEDVHLGNNCSVTRVLSLNYEFSYPVTSCGINKIVFQENDVFLLSEINYRPALGVAHTFQLVCFAKRIKLSSVVPFGMSGYIASAPADTANALSDTANTPSNNPRRTKEHKPLAPEQSNIHEPSLVCFNKDQLPMTSWANNVLNATSSPPRERGAE